MFLLISMPMPWGDLKPRTDTVTDSEYNCIPFTHCWCVATCYISINSVHSMTEA